MGVLVLMMILVIAIARIDIWEKLVPNADQDTPNLGQDVIVRIYLCCMYSSRNLEMSIHFSLKSRASKRFHRPEMSQIKAEISLHTNLNLNFHKYAGCQSYQWIPDFYDIRFEQNDLTKKNYVGSTLM